jgi:hypothetical protein
MRPRRPSGYASANRHTCRLELVLEFDGATSVNDAREVTRRVMDALQLSTDLAQGMGRLNSARIICHDLRRTIPLRLPSDAGKAEA